MGDAKLLEKMLVAKCANPRFPGLMRDLNFAMLTVQLPGCATVIKSAACGLQQEWGKTL